MVFAAACGRTQSELRQNLQAALLCVAATAVTHGTLVPCMLSYVVGAKEDSRLLPHNLPQPILLHNPSILQELSVWTAVRGADDDNEQEPASTLDMSVNIGDLARQAGTGYKNLRTLLQGVECLKDMHHSLMVSSMHAVLLGALSGLCQ